MSESKPPARTYNQIQIPRKYSKGRRRVSVYVTWSYPGETNRDPAELDNRFSTMTEVRRVTWPAYETPEYRDPNLFQKGIAGTLELFFRTWAPFQAFAAEKTGHVVPLYQRVDHAGYKLPLDERVLDETDTLFVFGLDHSFTELEAAPDEIEAVQRFLAREGTCLVLGPHHVLENGDAKQRQMEYLHHGDRLIPRHETFGTYCRSLMKGLGIPVDTRGWLEGVTTLNLHYHMPHYALTADDAKSAHVLARQSIDLSRPPHPFTEALNGKINTFVWLPPNGNRAGDIMMADSTLFSTLFGADESLERFWKNIVTAK
jgi:hypothetical protein